MAARETNQELVDLGRILRRARVSRELTLEAAAARVPALSPAHLGELERGLRNAQWLTLVRIADGYGLSMIELLSRYAEPQ